MIQRLLIANRGEIAVRVARGARELGITPVGIYSEADAHAYHLKFMDEAVCVGPPAATESYLDAGAIIAAAKTLRADAVHPGYGFLSERASFAQRVIDAGMIFVGPLPASMAAMSSKIEAKQLVRASGVPVVPGYDGEDQSPEQLRKEASRIGFPLLIKASAGGGGRGMRVVESLSAFDEALAAAKREAAAAFGDDTMLLERFLKRPRHIEFQILADAHGTTLHLGERECSIQRRHQKIVEEAPSVALTPQLREAMGGAAVRAAQSVQYVNAGTCEFMLDEDGSYYFLEMNTRLQVEHPVTELAYGIDLVHWQLRIANGERLTLRQSDVQPRGWAIETRVYAEDPANHLLPSTGTITVWDPPAGPGIRLDEGVERGSEVPVFYDPMLAKLIVWAENRLAATERITCALQDFRIGGIRANIPLLLWIARDQAFRRGETTTRFLEERLDESIFAKPSAPSRAQIQAAVARLLLSGKAPWRLGGVGIPLRLRIDDREVSIEANATSDPDVFVLTGDYNGEVDLRIAKAAASDADFSPPPNLSAAAHGSHGGSNGRVGAPMPGKIVKIAVHEGQQVATHDLLVVLEAMKMEHRIEASADGTVAGIFVREGDIVAADAPLVALE
ncbi:MAG TPA: acetyl-CoA carboxylase biotin carboxylase subunit [Candidatus Baltobacteraceae bacterium]|jgi:3-methylcrotonyl-CoA carboxylase alpha subunit|nr:acetyl-CoA carboxylase biotin carboxylase subunit [Candidatus Baltobacteraceae bacterium]